MKYLLVFAVVLIAIHFWRKGRRDELRARPPTSKAPQAPPAVGAPQAMVRCLHCGMHLPATDAIAGPGGSYCSVAHRKAEGG